jgi:hypothetical protein
VKYEHNVLLFFNFYGIMDEEKSAGIYNVNFSPTNLASGVYLFKLQAGGFVETRKMILVR